MIDSYFDKVFYINLPADVEREKNLLNQLEQYSISNIERIEGVIYEQPSDRCFWRNFIKKDEKYVLGSLGCRDAHLKAISIAKERKYERVLILEDDIYFLENPNESLHKFLSKNTDNWDMLYLSGLIEPQFRNQIVLGSAYAVRSKLFDDIIYMAEASGMEIDNFYAKIIQHMSYNYNTSGKYNIAMIDANFIVAQNKYFQSNIRY